MHTHHPAGGTATTPRLADHYTDWVDELLDQPNPVALHQDFANDIAALERRMLPGYGDAPTDVLELVWRLTSAYRARWRELIDDMAVAHEAAMAYREVRAARRKGGMTS